ncbi:DNA-binding protein [Thiotrichales bacterium 19S11-10]|nr:DNA-binding protein [Thiotrichales bacterium 19S11-10]MCF6807226.1 DNA-binding protein [Thiotrichales bacterium 19S9-11]MCF6811195.1 DNA-binding protein [Thiotrichales bacterium 19S9-12]
MARPGLTFEEVAQAAQQLLDEGENPTIIRIREVLGGKGSPNTISKFLKEWKLKNQQKSMGIEINEPTQKPSSNESLTSEKPEMPKPMTQATTQSSKTFKIDTSSDKNIQTLITHAQEFSQEILASMSNEWDNILNEKDDNIKIRRLHAALVKEQSRREAAEQIARETKIYASMIKDQINQRIHDVKESLEEQIIFLKNQIKTLKKESEENLLYYREKLNKANQALEDKLK